MFQFHIFFCQQPTFEDGEIELARTEVLAQDPMVDNKHALAVSLARSEMLVQDPMTDHKQALAMSLARSEIFVQDPMASEHKHPLAVSLSLGNTLINLNKIKCPQCRKVRILCSWYPTTTQSKIPQCIVRYQSILLSKRCVDPPQKSTPAQFLNVSLSLSPYQVHARITSIQRLLCYRLLFRVREMKPVLESRPTPATRSPFCTPFFLPYTTARVENDA